MNKSKKQLMVGDSWIWRHIFAFSLVPLLIGIIIASKILDHPKVYSAIYLTAYLFFLLSATFALGYFLRKKTFHSKRVAKVSTFGALCSVALSLVLPGFLENLKFEQNEQTEQFDRSSPAFHVQRIPISHLNRSRIGNRVNYFIDFLPLPHNHDGEIKPNLPNRKRRFPKST